MLKPIALVWFRPEDYDEIKRISDDELHATFEDFERRSEQRLEQLENVGLVVKKIIVRPGELETWARAKRVPINSNTRATFGALLLAQLEDGWLN
jgi:uncharacterized membrane-anchored protein